MVFTRASISALLPSGLNFGSVSTGSRFSEGGKSHSCDLPTSSLSNPSAQTISVALGNSVTIRWAMSTTVLDRALIGESIDGHQKWMIRAEQVFHTRRLLMALIP